MAMKLLPTSVSLLIVRLRQALRSLQASPRSWAPPLPVPVPVRVDRVRSESTGRRRHRGV